MRYDYDAIVVGARVAGASTAMLLARRGHRVLMIDRATMPSDTVSTHAILRSGILQLTRWGILDRVADAGTPPVRNMTLGFGDERIHFEMKDDYGIEQLYAPRRHLLDSLLVEAAVEAGAEFSDRTRMTGLVWEQGRVAGVEVSRRREKRRITAPVVIGADGVHSRLAGLVDAPTLVHHEPTNGVHYAYYTGVDTSGFWFQFTPGINAGLITTNDAVLAFAGRPAERFDDFGDRPDDQFLRLLSEAGDDLADRVAAGERVSRFHGTPGVPGFIRRPYGPGWVLVGDAGYTKDPISAHGISDAFRDAELCARAVDTALVDPSRETEALAEYQRIRDSLSWPMFEESRALAEFAWDPAEASARMRRVSDLVRQECAALLSLPDWPPVRTAVPA